MSDGREIINETYKKIKAIAEDVEARKAEFSESDYQRLEKEVTSSLDWAKKCRNKVWLRSKEGTDLAQGCLDAALTLESGLESKEGFWDASSSLLYKLENLAKIIATKASVMT